MEAVTDTKKSRNYIVTEYLAKNGVDMTEVTKGLRSPMSAASDPEAHVRNVVADPLATAEELQSPMDAASDPRDTSETLADLPSADFTVPQWDAQANTEKAGKKVPIQSVWNSEVLYFIRKRKRTTVLLKPLGFQLPIGLQHCGSIGSITYEGRSVKPEGSFLLLVF